MKLIISNLNDLTLQSNDNSKTLLSIAQENYVDWMHACGGKGRCTTCRVIVTEGMENLSEVSDAEIRFENMGRLDTKRQRLACQASLTGSQVMVQIPDECKLPHVDYSE